MRAIVFFDLPVGTAAQRKCATQFRKFLVKEGYLMMQESVYAKLLINDAAYSGALARLRKNRPPEGLIQVLKVSEGQYASMVYITGNQKPHAEVDTIEDFVVL